MVSRTNLLRAQRVHAWHLQGADWHLPSHRVHVLDVGVAPSHGDRDAHVVVHSLLG